MVVEGRVLVVQWVLALFGLPEVRGGSEMTGRVAERKRRGKHSENNEGNAARTTRTTRETEETK